MPREPISVFVTTFNNGATLRACLKSVDWADERVVLDSFSEDDTLAIAKEMNCTVAQQAFEGYGPQKQAALEMTRHRWVLLLDADEALTDLGRSRIMALLQQTPAAAGYRLPRIEQMFWRMQSPKSRLNYHLRLFDKTRGQLSEQPIHAAPMVTGRIEKLDAPFLHWGEPDIHTKVSKINHYSSGLVDDKIRKGTRLIRLRMLLYPPFFFIRSYLWKRQFINGWAGFISSVVGAFYVFLKYAKVYERRRSTIDPAT